MGNKVKEIKTISIIFCVAAAAMASNLANPAAAIPEARVAIGASYHLGGYTLTNKEIPSIFNRLHARVHYAPLNFLGIGVDLGAMQLDVDRYVIKSDTVPLFHGKFGFSGGAHLKVSTPPFLKERLSIVGIGQATYFLSKNKYDASYSGFDGTGAIGLQFHIPGFGYITAGPLLYLIQGENKSYTGEESFFSNANNLRGWLSIDFFPKFKDETSNKSYLSLELSISPKANASSRVPVQEFSISISLGSVTGRLYGVESGLDWEP
jgi:hypothetical protein